MINYSGHCVVPCLMCFLQDKCKKGATDLARGFKIVSLILKKCFCLSFAECIYTAHLHKK